MKKMIELSVGLLALLLLSSAAFAAPPPVSKPLKQLVDHRYHKKRMVVIIDEYANGKLRPLSYTEAAVIESLGQTGVRFVDAAQAQKLRSAASGKELLAGTIPPLVTSIEADYILAGVVEANRVQSNDLKDIIAFEVTANLRVIAADSSEITSTVNLAKVGQGFTEGPALQSAGKRLGEAIARALAEKAPASRTIDLTIETGGLLGQKTAEEIERGLKAIAGVTDVAVLHQDESILKVELGFSGVTTLQIARELDRLRPAGLAVKGYSAGAIKASYLPPPGVRLLLGSVDVPAKADRSLSTAVAKAIGASIAACNCVDLKDGSTFDSKANGALSRAVAASGAPSARTLYLKGTYQPVDKETVLLTASIVRASDRTTVASAQQSCKIAELGACVHDVGDRLAEGTKGWIAVNAPTNTALAARTPVRVRAKIGDLFPSLLARYADGTLGAGSVRIENITAGALDNLTLTIGIDDYTTADVDVPLTDLAPGAVIEPKVVLVLDRAKLSKQDETANAIMRITVAFSEGDFRLQETFRQPVLIHPRTAMRWDPEESIASFVESTSPAIIAEKDKIERSVPSELNADPLAFPVAAFRAMRELAYSADPIHPHRGAEIDFVQFPLETLKRKRGDCDDLAIVYASLLEAAGIRSLLLLTPGHVLVAFETPIPIHGAHTIVPAGLDFIRREGVVWIPVETTKVGVSFGDAWRAASKELARSTPKLIALDEAWKLYPPTNLAVGGAVLAEVRAADVEKEVVAVRPDPKVLRAAAASIKGEGARESDRRGILLAKAGDMPGARAQFESCLKTDPGYAPALVHLANLDLIEGRFAEALRRYEEALQRAPKSVDACLNAVIAARLTGDNQALAKYVDRCEKQPGFADVEEYLGRSRPEQVGLPMGGRIHLPVWLDE